MCEGFYGVLALNAPVDCQIATLERGLHETSFQISHRTGLWPSQESQGCSARLFKNRGLLSVVANC